METNPWDAPKGLVYNQHLGHPKCRSFFPSTVGIHGLAKLWQFSNLHFIIYCHHFYYDKFTNKTKIWWTIIMKNIFNNLFINIIESHNLWQHIGFPANHHMSMTIDDVVYIFPKKNHNINFPKMIDDSLSYGKFLPQ